jgi:ApaG protein
MNPLRAGFANGANFRADAGKIGGENAGRNQGQRHYDANFITATKAKMTTQTTTTKGDAAIAVSVRPRYLPDLSRAAGGENAFVFAYTITINNRGKAAAKLLSRRWLVTDGDNRTQEIRGAGVVGEQPRLAPGESFTYTSHVVLPTPVGAMRGAYQMEVEGADETMEVEIPMFTLRVPGATH